MIKKNKDKKQKKERRKLTKKQKIIIIIIAIILGAGAYFLGTVVTKTYLNNKKKEDQKIDFSEMTKLETIKNVSIDKLVSNYNKLLADKNLDRYKIDSNKLDKKDTLYEYTTNNITYVFQVNKNKVEIMTIYYKEENDDTKELIKLAMQANNSELTDEDVTNMYDSIIRTRTNKEEDGAKVSEYFQYKGIEANLKETVIGNKSIYQFRIGRITE